MKFPYDLAGFFKSFIGRLLGNGIQKLKIESTFNYFVDYSEMLEPLILLLLLSLNSMYIKIVSAAIHAYYGARCYECHQTYC